MNKKNLLCALVAGLLFACLPLAQASIIELGDLNIINDPENTSDGLRYLDMTYSDGLTREAAIANAQSAYPNARLATPAEFDDLFSAMGINYDTASAASSAHEAGSTITLSSGANYTTDLISILGETSPGSTLIWTDPDGDANISTTRDILVLNLLAVAVQSITEPANSTAGWLVVSEAPATAPVPAAAWLFGSGLLGLIGVARRKVRV